MRYSRTLALRLKLVCWALQAARAKGARRFALLIATCVTLAAVQAQPSSFAQAAPAQTTPDSRTQIEADMRFLADDLLEGREAGTRGFDLAALYVSTQLRGMGLQPAFNGNFLTPVPLRQSQIVENSLKLSLSGTRETRFTDTDHVTAYPSYSDGNEQFEAEMVYVGSGIVSRELGRDDYGGINVTGKIVVVLGGPPPGYPSEVAAHLGSPANKAAEAVKRGALGLIVIWGPAAERRLAFKTLAQITHLRRMDWHDPSLAARAGDSEVALAFVDETAAAAMFEGAAHSYADISKPEEAQRFGPFPLVRRLTYQRQSSIQAVRSDNVSGLVVGSDPALAKELIIVTAHLDHVGIGAPVNGDSIYNGAIDNASGVAASLAVARQIAKARPKRSILFLFTTAEEKGLVGSSYFSRSAPFGDRRVVATINLDGVMAFYDFQSVVGYGAESSTLRIPLERAVKSMGLVMMRDPNPQASIFTQSDHYPFVKAGIPSMFLQMGEGKGRDGKSGLEISDAWDATHLHQPSDDLTTGIDYSVFARFTELYRRFILEVANDRAAPRWYQGDFFGRTFAPNSPKAPLPQFQYGMAASGGAPRP